MNARFALVVMALIALHPTIVRATVTFYDGTFNDGDWQTSYTLNLGTGGGTPIGSATAAKQASGGNPGFYQRIDHVQFNDGIESLHYFSSAVYDPATDGAISAIDWSQDVMALRDHAQINIGFLALLHQGSTDYYENTLTLAPPNGSLNTWSSGGVSGLTQASFRSFASATAHPDFSTSGGPITFGYLAVNDNGGALDSRAAGVDNYRVVVNPAPEPSSIAMLVLLVPALLRRRGR